CSSDLAVFKLFVNGALEGQTAQARTIPYSSISWTIGATSPNIRSQNFPRTWNGVIDEVQSFNRALSQAEIQAIYAAGGAGQCKSPPTITSVVPNTGQQGRQNSSIALAGKFTNWTQGTTTANFGTGITVATLTINSATSATATLNIDPAATTGARIVTLTTGTEIAILANSFTITPAVNQPPTVSAGANQTIPLALSQIAFAEYPGPSGSASFESGIVMQEVTPGPDGNLWF